MLVACVAAGAFVARRIAFKVVRAQAVFKSDGVGKQCPVQVEVEGRIETTGHGGTVLYRWERSDGAMSEQRSVVVRGREQTVTDSWWISSPGKSVDVGFRLHVLAPNDTTSAEVRTRVECSN